ncbi:MAG: tetratricopeptide repeat protein, partial [Bacteroidales bacterium]
MDKSILSVNLQVYKGNITFADMKKNSLQHSITPMRHKATLSFAGLIFFIIFPVLLQAATADSLKTILDKHKQVDTAKVNLLNKLAYELLTADVEQANLYADQSQKLATRLNYQKGKGTSLWIKGILSLRTNPKEALNQFRQALRIAEQVNDKPGICTYLMAIGNVEKEMGDLKASDQSFQRALQIATTLNDKTLHIKLLYNISSNLSRKGEYLKAAEKLLQMIDLAILIDNKQMLSKGYSSIAAIFNMQGNSPQALEYYLSALRINESMKDQKSIFNNLIDMAGVQFEQNEPQVALKTIDQAFRLAKSLNNPSMISVCLTNIGNIYQQINHPDALKYLTEALEMARGKNMKQSANLLMGIGSVYTREGKFKQAEENLTEALDIAQKAGIKIVCSQALKLLGDLYYTKKQYARAINYVNRALQIGHDINYLEITKDSYQLLANIHAATGNYKEAYHSYINFKQLNDSIFNDKNVRKIAFLESAYKHDKEKQKYELEKDNQQLQIKSQRNFIFLLAAVTLLVIILSYQLYLSNQLKKKALRLEIDHVNSQLEYSRKELASAALKLVQNSESDAYCMQKLKNLEGNATKEGEQDVRSLINYYKNKSIHSNWKEFETLFLKVNTDFYEKLNSRFPTLTLNERKLCVFLKLNMTNKDITQITFQSEEALKKARMRLRKKMELERDENLASFIHTL